MPIRFRCAYCNQLMGIARRKAGTVVSCPTCHGQVVVPDPGPDAREDSEPANDADAQALFERSDFDQVFASPPGPAAAPPESPAAPRSAPTPAPSSAPAPSPAKAAAPWGATQGEVNFDVERLSAPAEAVPGRTGQAGFWLSPTAALLLGLLAVVLLAVAFVAGLLVGRSLGGKKQKAPEKTATRGARLLTERGRVTGGPNGVVREWPG